jgi:hypothetical protein
MSRRRVMSNGTLKEKPMHEVMDDIERKHNPLAGRKRVWHSSDEECVGHFLIIPTFLVRRMLLMNLAGRNL